MAAIRKQNVKKNVHRPDMTGSVNETQAPFAAEGKYSGIVQALCERLRLERIKSGMSQNELANMLGVNINTVRRYESGLSPNLEILLGLSEIFNVPLEVLVYGERKTGSIMDGDRILDVKLRLIKDILEELIPVDQAAIMPQHRPPEKRS